MNTGLLVPSVLLGRHLTTVQAQMVENPRCVIFSSTGNLTKCAANGLTRDNAIPLEPNLSIWFYAADQEIWVTYKLLEDSNVVWQLPTIDAGPFLETTIFANDQVTPALAYLRHSDRDPTAPAEVDRFDLGAQPGGTTLVARILVLDWPANGDAYILVRPSFVTTALADLPQASDTCGENCDALCEPWGGIDLARRQAENKPTYICNERLAPVQCQCFCKDFTVGDIDGSASCSNDDKLSGGAIFGIVMASLVFLCCIMAMMYTAFKSYKIVDDEQETRQLATKDDSQTELDTERVNDEVDLMKSATPAQLWDSVLKVPNADVVYTKVTELDDGSVLVKRKFRLHQPNEKGKTSQRLKLLFPDVTTASHHGFVPSSKKSPTNEPSETTESESEMEDNVIEEIPSLLVPDTKKTKKKKTKLKASTQRVVDKIEKRMKEEKEKSMASSSPGDIMV